MDPSKLIRFYGVTFGPGFLGWDRYDYALAVEKVLDTANKIEAEGIEVRFEGEVEYRAKSLRPSKGPDAARIEKIIMGISRSGCALNLHLSEYILSLFDSQELDNRFLQNFHWIIGHHRYQDGFIERIEEKTLSDILNIKESQITSTGELLKEDYGLSWLKENLLIENGSRPNNSIHKISALARKFEINKTFDIGHFMMGFYELDKKGKTYDSLDNYSKLIPKTGREINQGIINSLSENIVHLHVHGVRWMKRGEFGYAVDHVPLDRQVINSPQEYRLAWNIIQNAKKIDSYTVELQQRLQTVQNLRNTIQNFENFETYFQKLFGYSLSSS